MTDQKTKNPISEQEKQTQPMPGEVNTKSVKVEVFMAMQKAKNKLKGKR